MSDEDFIAMRHALHKRFEVQPLNMPGNVGTMVFAAGFIEIALGALAAGVGTLALKKVIELITEDLYNCAKDFAKSYIHHRKASKFVSPTTQLQLTFELNDVFFGSIIDSDDEDDIVLALQSVEPFFELCNYLLASKSLPQDTKLIESKIREENQQEVKSKVLDSNVELPDLDSVVFIFDAKSKQWKLVGLTTVDGLNYKVENSHAFLWGQFIRELDRWEKRKKDKTSK